MTRTWLLVLGLLMGALCAPGCMAGSGMNNLLPKPKLGLPYPDYNGREYRAGRPTYNTRQDHAESYHLNKVNYYRAAIGKKPYGLPGAHAERSWMAGTSGVGAANFWFEGPYCFKLTRNCAEATERKDARGRAAHPSAPFLLPVALAIDIFGLPLTLILDFFRWLIGPPVDQSVLR
ncbi:MAG: hypothetical protein ACYTGX_16480 [Planctomycetota bacterium]|jgi:hypothetical protein